MQGLCPQGAAAEGEQMSLISRIMGRVNATVARIVGALAARMPAQAFRGFLLDSDSVRPGIDAFENEDYFAATAIFRELGENGNVTAQYNMGACCEAGSGMLAKDDDEAAVWYRRAAESGLAQAQFALACVLAADEVASPDSYDEKEQLTRLGEGLTWSYLAAWQGLPEGRTAVKRISRPAFAR